MSISATTEALLNAYTGILFVKTIAADHRSLSASKKDKHKKLNPISQIDIYFLHKSLGIEFPVRILVYQRNETLKSTSLI